jgi:hypothetical protein
MLNCFFKYIAAVMFERLLCIPFLYSEACRNCREADITEKCRKLCKKRKTGKGYALLEHDSILLTWYLDVQASCIPADGNIFFWKRQAGR